MAADTSLYTTWSAAYPGRETMALTVFQEAVAYYEKKKAAGKLANLHLGITQLGPVTSQSGYMIAEGTPEQIMAITADEEFMRIVTKATHCCPFAISRCTTGPGVGTAIERLLGVRKELGIT
jgi:hypothetical protein